jgi:hypothetical protein
MELEIGDILITVYHPLIKELEVSCEEFLVVIRKQSIRDNLLVLLVFLAGTTSVQKGQREYSDRREGEIHTPSLFARWMNGFIEKDRGVVV